MSFVDKQKALINWVRLATGFPESRVIWANQNMPRPVLPYITLLKKSFKSIGRETILPPNDEGASSVINHKEFTLSLSCYADKSVSADEVMLNLQDSLVTQKYISFLAAQQLVFVRVLMGPTDTSVLKDTQIEQRATMDLLMRMPWELTDVEQGNIELVEYEGVLNHG